MPTTKPRVTIAQQPIVHQVSAEFTTESGMRFQIVADKQTGRVFFGVKVEAASEWSYGMFRYAEVWRDRRAPFRGWTVAQFERMVSDFLDEGVQP